MALVHLGTSGRSKKSAASGVAMRVTSKLRQKRTGKTSVPGQMRKALDICLPLCSIRRWASTQRSVQIFINRVLYTHREPPLLRL